jgi:hypothetical protein
MTDQATQDATTDAQPRPAVAGQVERAVMRPVECRTVAALYVQPKGCYVGVPGVDPWDEARDARKYAGPHPAVAHPPCSRWSRLAKFCEARHGLKVGDDGGCFEAALAAVRQWGGVIEHPAFTMAWARYGLPRPDTKAEHWTPGICGGFSAYVEQGRYGHPVKKATWLYVFGVRLQDLPELRWGHTPDNRGTIAKNQDWRGGMDKWRDNTGHRLANATPPAFRDLLLSIARKAHNVRAKLPA